MVYVLVLVVSIALGEQISVLRSSQPLPSMESCVGYVEHLAKEGKLQAEIESQVGSPVRLEFKCVPADKDA